MIPRFGKLPAEERDKIMKGPMGFLILRNPATQFSFPAALISYFIYTLVISILVAYIPAATLRPGALPAEVFRVVGTAGILAYAFGTIPDAIWYGKPWSVAIKNVIDGVIYGLLTAGTFSWPWPRQ